MLKCTMIGASLQDGSWQYAVIITAVMVLCIFIGMKVHGNLSGKNENVVERTDTKKYILLSEGSSLSSHETLTFFIKSGYLVDIISLSKLTVSSVSNWRHRVISTVSANKNVGEFLCKVSELINTGKYKAIITTDEQAWLISETMQEYPAFRDIIASPEAFRQVQGKITFAQLAQELHLPHPKWLLLTEETSIELPYPYWIKAIYGTAGRSVIKIERS